MALSKSTELFDRSGPCLRNRRNRRTYQTAWKVGAIPERSSQNYSRQKTSTRVGDTGTASESGIESRAKLAPNSSKTGVFFFSFLYTAGWGWAGLSVVFRPRRKRSEGRAEESSLVFVTWCDTPH